MIEARANYFATALLVLMSCLGVTSLWNDSATFDELAHVPAGYSYVRFGDYRLNPEHPPLMKDLAGLSLQFLKLDFPTDEPSWVSRVNDQWELGQRFLYTAGNDADQILFWARVPMLLFAVGFGFVLFVLCRRRWGANVALLALFFYTLSPNILAHARYVTTDVGASAFFFLAIVAFVGFVERPNTARICLLALALAAAQLAKFSAITVLLYLGLVTMVVIWAWPEPSKPALRLKVYGGGFVAACILSLVLVWLFYLPHTMNMPGEVQDQLIRESLTARRLAPVAQALIYMNDFPLVRPFVAYLTGLCMVFNRVAGGGLTYFNGEVSIESFKWYFPELFLVKTQVAFLILSTLGLGSLLCRNPDVGRLREMRGWLAILRTHFALCVLAGFSVFYFLTAVFGNLNLGVRHILPVYVPLFVLVSVWVVRWCQRIALLRAGAARAFGFIFLSAMLVWYGASCVIAHPSYTSYFNEFIGGPGNSDKYFADSSVDWGQDLRRLKHYVDARPEIRKLAIDYQGGGSVKYYFCSRVARSTREPGHPVFEFDCGSSKYDDTWAPSKGPFGGEYIAVSETRLANDRYSDNRYADLRDRVPDAKIGYSIFLYKLR